VTDPGGNLIGRFYRGDFNITFSASVAAFPSCQLQYVRAHVDFDLLMDPSGTTVIRSFFEEYIYNSDFCPGAIGPPARVTLQPLNAVNPVGTTHTVTATVTDINGNPVPNTTVDFTVTGAVNKSGSCTTDQNGQCPFTYQGPPLPGADAISGCVTTVFPGGGTQTVCGEAAKEWVLPASTPGQCCLLQRHKHLNDACGLRQALQRRPNDHTRRRAFRLRLRFSVSCGCPYGKSQFTSMSVSSDH